MAQCVDLKRSLVELDRENTGRVRLVDFYKKDNVSNNWFLEEKMEYLRHVGCLDESSAVRGPQVIIANYVQAPSNCLEVSPFYSICCQKECEGLLGMIEREIRAPFASPARIMEVAQQIIKAHADEPRNLTTQMATQLEAVAEHHGGEVPLHGRLFAQWMHYTFPHECPYPQLKHEADHHLLTSEYEEVINGTSMMSYTEIQDYIHENQAQYSIVQPASKGPADEEDWDATSFMDVEDMLEDTMTQWTMEEELYVGVHHRGPRAGIRGSMAWWSMVTPMASLGLLGAGLFCLSRFYQDFFPMGTGAGGMKRKSGSEASASILV